MGKFNVNRVKVQQCVEQLAISKSIRSFYPEYVSKILGIPMDDVIRELAKLVEDGCLELKFEIKSTESTNIVKLVDDFSNYIGTDLEDNMTGEIFEVEYDNIFPCYYICKEYRDYLKKKLILQRVL